MEFLPEDYQAPNSSNNYFKIQQGENRIRILSQPVFGWEDWHDKKPVRYRMNEKPNKSFDPKKPIKHFWAFIVFNYREEQVQIMQVTQATIRKSLEALCRDKDWGAPFAYDIKITKSGEGVDTEYTVNPVPHKPVDEYITKCFKEKPINLEALFDNSDPFSPLGERTEMGNVKFSNTKPKEESLNATQAVELSNMFAECDPTYKKQLLDAFAKLPEPVDDIRNIPASLYEKVRKAVIKNRDEFKRSMQQEQVLVGV